MVESTLKENKGEPMGGELQTEEDKVSLDVNKKRRVKTPAQVMALENFYKEDRFPSDELKEKLAVQIGLTQKQISSWFCHRRLKDKRRDDCYANVQHDHSSGVIQDRGSGLRQDSSGSIKQGDYRYIDPREVESRRIFSQRFPATYLTYECRGHQNPYDVQMEDTASESSLSSHDQLFSESGNPYDMRNSAKLTQNGSIVHTNLSSNSMGYKPSGYLKVKGVSENPVIAAVKKLLGRHYREDGPVLSIQFDPLPPGAFEFPSIHTVSELINARDSQQDRCPDTSGVMKHPKPKIINEEHYTMLSSQDSYMKGANFNTVHGSERQDRKSHHEPKHKPSFSCSNPFPRQDSRLDIYKVYADKPAVNDCKRSRMSSKLAIGRMVSDSFSNYPVPYGEKITNEHESPGSNADTRTYISPKIENLPKTSNLISACSDSLGTERGPFVRTAKVENVGAEWKLRKDYLVGVKVDATNELRVVKQVNFEFPQQDFVANVSHARLPLLTNPSKGSSMDVPCSLSEDETAETSLSSRIDYACG
ncbi:hypothetical protein like AT4G03250 [Hibiscus trionum]|uniref:Homeobox domain-containing protein n=1 Tax=Hibiscus trionum TaxID=183268 RepID=A0A9W7I484_HIBTR|nr:hypothetical protein like AT4G03250 [Hibiscus trionum]